jgi:hypothetical protein
LLAEAITRIGRPIAQSSLPNEKRIRWLSDVDSVNCKNYFKHVFIVELLGEETVFHFLTIGNKVEKDFIVDEGRNKAFPIFYPQGGNPLKAQGIYPVPCYLMYGPHIKKMNQPNAFAQDVILPRLKSTVSYLGKKEEELELIAKRTAELLAHNYESFIQDEKQLGILYIYDHSLQEFQTFKERGNDQRFFWITESKLLAGDHLYLDSEKTIEDIIKAKFTEAKELGHEEEAVSTFTNETGEVVSVYNKFWLWLSPTWEMPRSIYWGKKEWTKGIKVDRQSYEAFLYGTQFLKLITVPISSGILKEMFAPIMNVEAKKHMKATSFKPVFGAPLVTPLLDGDSEQLYQKYLRILDNEEKTDSDIHLELLAGINRIIPSMSDEHRLMLLYYSGDLSRGNMHVRLVIEDIVPSVAEKLQKIVKSISKKEILKIRKIFGINNDKEFYRVRSLPSLLSNAYGPGYVWSSLQTVLQQQPISVERLYGATSRKLNELANKEDHWGMINELTFHYAFLAFFNRYQEEIVKKEGKVKTVSCWSQMLEQYHTANIKVDDLHDVEKLGFVTGLLLKQFSNSYHHKTGKDFVKHRVMKFGSKLTPQMIWKSGLARCKELQGQWDMGIARNFDPVLSHVLLGFLDAEKENLLVREKDRFMTAFWSGYLMYKKVESEGGDNDDN